MANFLPQEIIKRKRQGEVLSAAEIQFMIRGYVSGAIPDYQISAWLMAIFLKGFNADETAWLTGEMLNSGDRVIFPDNLFPVDKHSTGGIGDKTSLILGPIAACAGVPVPMISGRGLGHTGGTLDKLESIPGFQVFLGLQKFKQQTEDMGLCFIGQTGEICPADQKMYALRDVTATVDAIPLICASIMSKKIAEGIKGLVLDVKFGSGAFMKTREKAETLAKGLMTIGRAHGVNSVALLTNMDQPMGRFSGNAVEVFECLEIMRGKTCVQDGIDYYSDVRDLSVELAAWMIFLGKKSDNIEIARSMSAEILRSGKALKKFEDVVLAQGGRIKEMKSANTDHVVVSPRNGFIEKMDAEKIGLAAIYLGAGRRRTTDQLDYTAGIETLCRLGMSVREGQPLFRIFAQDNAGFVSAEALLLESLTLADHPPVAEPLIWKTLRGDG